MNNHTQKIFWNAETMARMLDVSLDDLMLFTQLLLIPMPVLLHNTPLWRISDVHDWARRLKAITPAEAVATLWVQWQRENDPRRVAPSHQNNRDDDWNLFDDDNEGGV